MQYGNSLKRLHVSTVKWDVSKIKWDNHVVQSKFVSFGDFIISSQLAQLEHLSLSLHNCVHLPLNAASCGLAALHNLHTLCLINPCQESLPQLLLVLSGDPALSHLRICSSTFWQVSTDALLILHMQMKQLCTTLLIKRSPADKHGPIDNDCAIITTFNPMCSLIPFHAYKDVIRPV
jgi:hypothetical protein